MAHVGFTKIWSWAMVWFYWCHISDSNKQWIVGRVVCAKAKGNKGKTPLHQDTAGAFMEKVGVELVWPLPLLQRLNHNILTVTDYFTK